MGEHRQEFVLQPSRTLQLEQLHLVLSPQPGPLEHGSDPRQQLASRKWLGQIVVGAGAQAFDPGFLARASRKQDDGYRGQLCVAADGPQQLKPIHLRHHDIRDDQAGTLATNRRKRRLAVCDGLDVVIRRDQSQYIFQHVGVVVREDDPRPKRGGKAPVARCCRILRPHQGKLAATGALGQPALGFLHIGIRVASRSRRRAGSLRRARGPHPLRR